MAQLGSRGVAQVSRTTRCRSQTWLTWWQSNSSCHLRSIPHFFPRFFLMVFFLKKKRYASKMLQKGWFIHSSNCWKKDMYILSNFGNEGRWSYRPVSLTFHLILRCLLYHRQETLLHFPEHHQESVESESKLWNHQHVAKKNPNVVENVWQWKENPWLFW